MSDPGKYRTKEEVEKYKNLDPISQVLDVILKNKYLSEKEIAKIDDDIKTEVDDCVKFAEDSPLPELDELYKDVYMQEDYPFIIE